MRLKTASPIRFLCVGLSLVAMTLVFDSAAHAQASNNPKQQTVYLADPTPRPPDLNLKLKDNPQAGTSTQEAVEHQKQKRRELVVWASDELVTLSEHVQSDVTKPQTEATTASAVADAEKIEQLAKNLTAALKAP